jgi:transposase InsO family protein
MIGLSTTAYYDQKRNERSEAKEKEDADLCSKIEGLQNEYSCWGYRTIKVQLKKHLSMQVNKKKILRIMRKFGLFHKIKRHFVKTTDSNHGFKIYPNLLKGKTVNSLNRVWVSDITYIRILNGFVFLAVIIDLYSRRVVGWAISRHINHELTVAALLMAIETRKPGPGLIHHSDRGVQYACQEYVAALQANKIQISMSAKGNPYDNAFAESFFKTLKKEEVYLWEYVSFADVVERIPQFIEKVYNTKRVHSGIEYLTPQEFEAILQDEERRNTLGQATLNLVV